MIDITQIIVAIIAVLGAVITTVLIPYIMAKTTATQQSTMQTWVNIGVFAAEQIFKSPGMGDAKESYVESFLKKRGITYDVTAVRIMIEAAVKTLKIAQGTAPTVTASEVAVDTDLLSGKYII